MVEKSASQRISITRRTGRLFGCQAFINVFFSILFCATVITGVLYASLEFWWIMFSDPWLCSFWCRYFVGRSFSLWIGSSPQGLFRNNVNIYFLDRLHHSFRNLLPERFVPIQNTRHVVRRISAPLILFVEGLHIMVKLLSCQLLSCSILLVAL